TRTARVELEQKRLGRLTGRLGMEWLGRGYTPTGAEALSPPTRQGSLSTFAYEELQFGRIRVQLGGRIERTAYRPDERPAGAHDHDDDDDHDDHDDEHRAPPVRDRTFTGASGSAGLHADIGATGAFVM